MKANSIINKTFQSYKKMHRYTKIEMWIAVILTIAIIVAIPVYAWFSNQRQLKDMKEVNAPTGLYVSAAQKEDIKYLNLSGIDLKHDENGSRVTSSYYVFCVYGSTRAYNLQLAYTTNNPFEYKIYPAISCEDNDVDKKVDYFTHDSNGNPDTAYHYKIDGNQILTGNLVTRRIDDDSTVHYQNNIETVFLNKTNASDRLANSTKHELTYGDYSSAYVQQYAEPVYWQARGIRSSMSTLSGSSEEFCDYYILEVNWRDAYLDAIAHNTDLSNDRETDIIYIVVESTTWSGDW